MEIDFYCTELIYFQKKTWGKFKLNVNKFVIFPEIIQDGPFLQTLALNKLAKFPLFFWCSKFVEMHFPKAFRENCTILCKNCSFPKNIHTRKLGEIFVFYAVQVQKIVTSKILRSYSTMCSTISDLKP